MQDTNWTGEGVVNSILDRIRATARVELVYGEERRIGEKTIIPVAAVAYAFGGGGGGGAGSGPAHNGHSEDAAGVGGPIPGPTKLGLRLPAEERTQAEVLGRGADAAPAVVDLLQRIGVLTR